MATGQHRRVLRRDEGMLELGRPADLVLAFAPLGSALRPTRCLHRARRPAGIGAMVIDGEVRALRSRNTPAPDGRCRFRDHAEVAA